MEINRTNIQGIWQKCKPFLADDLLFFSIVLCLIATISFGLGRLSVQNTEKGVAAVARVAGESVSHKAISASNAATTSSDTIFVGSKNSDKYHLPWCSGAKRIKEENKITWHSKAEAEAAGYSPAGNCEGI